MMGLPEAFLAHRVPGRFRLRVPHKRGDEAFFELCQRKLAERPEVSRVRVNPRTGSILVRHAEDDLDVAMFVRELDFVELRDEPFGPPLSGQLRDRLYAFADDFKRATGGQVDVSGLSIVVLTALGFYQIAREKALPAGWTMLWHASSLVRQAENGASVKPPVQPVQAWTTH